MTDDDDIYRLLLIINGIDCNDKTEDVIDTHNCVKNYNTIKKLSHSVSISFFFIYLFILFLICFFYFYLLGKI